MHDPDGPLVDRAKRGDRWAFEQLVERHQHRMFTLAARTLGALPRRRRRGAGGVPPRLARASRRFRGGSLFSTWLYRICLERRPRPAPQAPGEPVELVERADPRDAFAESELSSELQAALDSLDETYRVAVVLYDVLGCSYAEIAEMTGVPEGTVKSRIYRGRTELAQRLGTKSGASESKT